MSSCSNRTPNTKRLIELMDDITLLAYSRVHISMDSQVLIDTLAKRLTEKIKAAEE